MTEPQADVLAKILLLQNMVGQLPDRTTIEEFLTHGLTDLPGVTRVRFLQDVSALNADATMEWPVHVDGTRQCSLVLDLGDRQAFAPYAAFVGNLCFMVTVVLERAAQRTRMEENRRALEDEVARRTLALRQQVAERERAERQAVEDRARAEFVLEVSELLVVELDPAGRARVINNRGCEILGRPRREVVGADWFSLAVPEQDRERMRELFRAAVAGQAELPHFYQNDIVTRTGGTRTIAWVNRVERSPDGKPQGTISAGTDMTARVAAERALITEKERLATTLRSIGEGVITTDEAGLVTNMNAVAQQLTGVAVEAGRGLPLDRVYRLVDERDRSPASAPWRQALETGRVVESKAFVLLVAKDGTQRAVTDSLSPIRDSQGNTLGLVLVFRDETERRRMMSSLVRSDRLEALGVLAGGIAHDFNNLLGGIFGYIDLAQQESTESEVKSSLDMAKTVFVRARDLTQQLLTFAKGGTPVKKSMSIAPIVRESIAFALSGTSVASQIEIPADLWACDVDKNQLGQVIDNLVINAVQAMPGGGILSVKACNETIRMDDPTQLLEPGEYVSVSITDSGVGIPPSLVNRIFDPFFTTKQTGSGLGLATCHSIMQRHGGAIDVRSTPGAGATFTLRLRASKRVPDLVASEAHVHHAGQGIVLVMDDEEYLLEVICQSLRRMGYETVQAENGEAALAAWATLRSQEGRVCAAFLDLTVRGGMGGKDTARALRDAGFSAPLFATSGYSEDPVMSTPADFGFTASLGKPFSLRELSQFMQTHVAGRGPDTPAVGRSS